MQQQVGKSQKMQPLKDKSLVGNIIKEINRKYQKEHSLIDTFSANQLPIHINSYFNEQNRK